MDMLNNKPTEPIVVGLVIVAISFYAASV
jgi:hypothetical protein